MSAVIAEKRSTYKSMTMEVEVDVNVDLVLEDFETEEIIAELSKRGVRAGTYIETLCFDAERLGWARACEDLRHELMRDGLLRIMPTEVTQ